MTDVLSTIMATKRGEIASAKQQRPLADCRRRAADAGATRPFYQAMTQPIGRLRVLAEIKRASPSAGLIREDFDPAAIAQAYWRNGAAAISCLTDASFFQGDLAYIAMARAAAPLPVLRKDFIVDPYQVYEARAAEADAILLIAECVDDDALLADLMALAGELGMGVLLEIYRRENLDRVQRLIANGPAETVLLGINNRDLTVMKTDLAHTIDLLPAVEDAGILVSESGIRTAQDVTRLRRAGVHRILVGESLMKQVDIGAALRSLLEAPAA